MVHIADFTYSSLDNIVEGASADVHTAMSKFNAILKNHRKWTTKDYTVADFHHSTEHAQ